MKDFIEKVIVRRAADFVKWRSLDEHIEKTTIRYLRECLVRDDELVGFFIRNDHVEAVAKNEAGNVNVFKIPFGYFADYEKELVSKVTEAKEKTIKCIEQRKLSIERSEKEVERLQKIIENPLILSR